MSTRFITAWRVTLTVETALHIGDGSRYREGADFVLEGANPPNQARLVDVDRALFLMTEQEVKRAARDGMIARALGDSRRAEVTLALMRLHRIAWDARPGEVLALIRDANGRPYIPGSSLKGAIRTAVLRELVSSGDRAGLAQLSEWREARKLEQDFFRAATFPNRRASDANRDLFRVLHVSDLHHRPQRLPNVAFVETQVRRVGAGGERVLSVWIEAILRGTEFTGTVSLDEGLLRKWPGKGVAKELFQQLPEVLRRDGEKTVRAMAEWAEKIVPSMQWTTVTPKARSWLFPLGWGTGWLAHTIGPVLSPDERRALANRLKLGRGQAPKSVPFPRSMKVARVPVGDRTQEVPLGLVSVQFTPLCQAGIRE